MVRKTYLLFGIAVVVIGLFAASVLFHLRGREDLDNPSTAIEITAKEVALHVHPDSCWIIVGSRVYNMSPFLASHPENQTYPKLCGSNATEALSASIPSSQSQKIQDTIGPYYIGLLAP